MRFIISLVLLCLMAVPAFAQGDQYVNLKLGAYIPQGDIDEFDAGFAMEGVFGKELGPNFAIEGGLGFIFLSETESTPVDSATIELTIIPITFTGKVFAKSGGLMPYAGAGIGLYVANLDLEYTLFGVGSASDDDTAITLGGHFLAGLGFEVSDRASLGIEAKYNFTADAEFDFPGGTIETNLNGIQLTAVLGLTF